MRGTYIAIASLVISLFYAESSECVPGQKRILLCKDKKRGRRGPPGDQGKAGLPGGPGGPGQPGTSGQANLSPFLSAITSGSPFSLQLVAPNAPILFNNTISSSGASITAGVITVTQAGLYEINFGATFGFADGASISLQVDSSNVVTVTSNENQWCGASITVSVNSTISVINSSSFAIMLNNTDSTGNNNNPAYITVKRIA